MIDLTRTTGQKLLFEGKHEQAVPAAMQSLRFAIDVHGLASIELVPSYLILGEASIGMYLTLLLKILCLKYMPRANLLSLNNFYFSETDSHLSRSVIY
jgi:hypothetical protein